VGGAIGIKFLCVQGAPVRVAGPALASPGHAGVAQRGREIAAERGFRNSSTFTAEFSEGDGFDVLFASGVVQYLPKRLGEMLEGYKQLPRASSSTPPPSMRSTSSSRSTASARRSARIESRHRQASSGRSASSVIA
jgi:hypothetical protein